MMRRKEFFDARASQWHHLFYSDTRHLNQIDAIVARLHICSGDNILDVGCGTGIISEKVMPLIGPQGSVTGVDFSLNMLKEIRIQDCRFQYVCCDAQWLPFKDRHFDKAVLFSCFPHFTNKSGVLQEVARTLVPGGSMFICHTSSSRQIACMHRRIDPSVCYDVLPPKPDLEKMFVSAGLTKCSFIDRRGLYFVRAVKSSFVSEEADFKKR